MTAPTGESLTVRAFLGLGSNLGDRWAHLRKAVDQLRAGSRAAVTAVFMAAAPLSTALGSPISGALLGLNGMGGMAGWQWVYLLEAAPALTIAASATRQRPDSTAPHWTLQSRAVRALSRSAAYREMKLPAWAPRQCRH